LAATTASIVAIQHFITNQFSLFCSTQQPAQIMLSWSCGLPGNMDCLFNIHKHPQTSCKLPAAIAPPIAAPGDPNYGNGNGDDYWNSQVSLPVLF